MYWSWEHLLIIVAPFGFLMNGNVTLHQLTIIHGGCRERGPKKSAHIVNQHARKHVGGRAMLKARQELSLIMQVIKHWGRRFL